MLKTASGVFHRKSKNLWWCNWIVDWRNQSDFQVLWAFCTRPFSVDQSPFLMDLDQYLYLKYNFIPSTYFCLQWKTWMGRVSKLLNRFEKKQMLLLNNSCLCFVYLKHFRITLNENKTEYTISKVKTRQDYYHYNERCHGYDCWNSAKLHCCMLYKVLFWLYISYVCYMFYYIFIYLYVHYILF